jgi:predicted enzyme related to lactoylglutathione lyase
MLVADDCIFVQYHMHRPTRSFTMQLLDHVSIAVNDLDRARPFYDAAYYAAFVKDPEGHRLEAVCHAHIA